MDSPAVETKSFDELDRFMIRFLLTKDAQRQMQDSFDYLAKFKNAQNSQSDSLKPSDLA